MKCAQKMLLSTILFVLTIFYLSHIAMAATYDMDSTDNWNIRIDGALAGDWVPYGTITSGDFDGDGLKDIVMGSWWADNNSRGSSGSVWVIYGSLLNTLDGEASTLDLSDPSSYNLRFDGASANDYLGTSVIHIGDLDNDGADDLLIGAYGTDYNSRATAGSLYVIYNSLISSYTGTGNNVDLDTSTNYNLRFDGPLANTSLTFTGGANMGDLNDNGDNDLLISAREADYNNQGGSGSIWIIYDSILESYSGTGNNIDLATATNFNLRIDGSDTTDDEYCLGARMDGVPPTDFDGDGKLDLAVGAYAADHNGLTDNGAYYLIYNTILDDYSGTGNTFNVDDPSKYNIRFEGEAWHEAFGVSSTMGDFDNDGLPDLAIGASDGNNAGQFGANGTGYVYLIYNTLIDDYSGTGNNVNLSSATNYNIRFAGNNHVDQLGGLVISGDLDNDRRDDLVITAGTSSPTHTNSGALYTVLNTTLDDYSDTANQVNIETENIYASRFDGAAAGHYFSQSALVVDDLNNDGLVDIVAGARGAGYNSRATSGSVWIIYNFPHTITLNDSNTYINQIEGSVAANMSITNIAGVEWSNETTFAGSWYSCTATDGVFGETTEDFTCNTANGNQGNIYIRSYDAVNTYTPIASYLGNTGSPLILDLSAPDGESNAVAASDKEDTKKDRNRVTIERTDEREIRLHFRPEDTLTEGIMFMVSGHQDFDDATWRAYDSDIRFLLANKEGKQKIYVKFKDDAGNNSDVDELEIVLDRTAPNIGITNIGTLIPDLEKFHNYFYTDSLFKLRGEVDEEKTKIAVHVDGNKVYEEKLKNTAKNFDTDLNLDPGLHTIRVESKDQSGNKSPPVEFTIMVDPTRERFPDSLK
jgi:hypothetical protein